MLKYEPECQSLDDPRFRISMTQQMAASCTGALITSLLSKYKVYLLLVIWPMIGSPRHIEFWNSII